MAHSTDSVPAMIYEDTFENKVLVTGDGTEAKKLTRSTHSRLLSPKAKQMSFVETKDLGNEPLAGTPHAIPGPEGETRYAKSDPWEGQLFEYHQDSKPIG